MRLLRNWLEVLKRAWSVRLMAAAFVFTALETAWPFLDGLLPIPPRTFAVLAGLFTAAAFVARLMAQKGLSDEET